MSEITARREARMRKILENSTNRLKKITLANDINSSDEIPTSSLHKSVPLNEEVKEEITEEHFDNEITDIFQNPTPEPRNSLPPTEFLFLENEDITLREIIIIVLALLLRYVFLICDYLQKTDVLIQYRLDNIFVPFFVFEIADYTFFKPFSAPFAYFRFISMFNLGISYQKLEKIIYAIRILLHVTQDIMIYFFTFVCFNNIIDYLVFESN